MYNYPGELNNTFVAQVKKVIVTILAFLYLATTTGATVHLHYCMDKLVEQNFWHKEKETCGNCGMDKKEQADKTCCNDKYKQIKVENDQNISDFAFQALHFTATALSASFIEIPTIAFSSITEENPTGNAPPLISSIALYKRNCVFRI